MMVEKIRDCLTCQYNQKADPELGGVVWETDKWRVEHSVGNSAGVSAMVVKLKRHVEWLEELTGDELGTLGHVLGKVTKAMREVTGAERVYVNLWNESSRHVHFLLQPRLPDTIIEYGGLKASQLQAAMDAEQKPIDKTKAKEIALQIKQKLQEIEEQLANEKFEEVKGPDGRLWGVSLVGSSLAVIDFAQDNGAPNHKLFPTAFAAERVFKNIIRQIEEEGTCSFEEGKVRN